MGKTMKLITEYKDFGQDITYLTEDVPGVGKKYFISGIFLQANVKNRNNRIYPEEIMEREVNRYTNNYILKRRAFGELGHPEGPLINLDRVSHLIEHLTRDGSNWIGKAKILDTPNGKIVKAMIDDGAQLGVSSRGVGSLTNKNGVNIVGDDFMLSTAADIVADPSAPAAFVNGIMEGKEWVWNNGILKEEKIAEIAKTIKKRPLKKGIKKHVIDEESAIKAFSHFLSEISKY
jgi:hypothetical protein